MTHKIKWLSPNLGELYSRLWRNLGTSEFETEVVKMMFPEWSTNYINKNLHDLVKRGWAQRLKKGTFRLKDFEHISEQMALVTAPLELFLNIPYKEDFLITSYLASQLLTNYVHTAPKITLLCTSKTCQKLRNFLKAKSKILDRNTFQLFRGSASINILPIHPLKYKRLVQNSKGAPILNSTFRITGPCDTFEFLAKEKEERRLADIAYLMMKTELSRALVGKIMEKEEIHEIEEMIKAKRDSLIESTSEDILEMNLVTT